MCTIDDIGAFAMDQFHLLLCEVSPEEINDIVVETINFSDDAISEIHPAELRVAICRSISYRQRSIQKQNALFSPFIK